MRGYMQNESLLLLFTLKHIRDPKGQTSWVSGTRRKVLIHALTSPKSE